MNEGVCWLDGNILPLAQASIPVLDRGLLYGDRVFEGIRFYAGFPFMLDEHLQRLKVSARAIALLVPWNDDQLTRIIGDVIHAFDGDDDYIRLIVTCGEGPLGIDSRPCRTPRLIVIASRLEMVNPAARTEGVRLITDALRSLHRR